jgi:putative phosphoribosyl transferase
VSRGGRPDLAGTHCLRHVQCPVLLLVGGNDLQVLELNRRALAVLQESKAATQVDDPIESRLDIIPGATHLFEEVCCCICLNMYVN